VFLMSAKILDGKTSSQKWLEESKSIVDKLQKKPTLALVRVGNDVASGIYLKKKKNACEHVGIKSLMFEFPDDATQEEIISKIEELNSDSSVTGILVQVPVPKQIDTILLQQKINAKKDVDGFGPYNMGMLFMGKPQLVAATPAGVMRLLDDYNLDASGKICVVVGRSNIVGKPLSMLLLQRNATVIIAHSKTSDLASVCKQADFVFVAVGKCGLITKDMVRAGAVVVDIGMNRPEKGPICGDADFESVSSVASYITPVPGGVGPMTIASLIANTIFAHKLQTDD